MSAFAFQRQAQDMSLQRIANCAVSEQRQRGNRNAEPIYYNTILLYIKLEVLKERVLLAYMLAELFLSFFL